MKFKFKIQQYQTDAVEQTVNIFAGQPSKTKWPTTSSKSGKNIAKTL